MSSNPFKAPTSSLSDIDNAPVCSMRWSTESQEKYKKYKTLEGARDALSALDMEPAPAVVIPTEDTVDPQYRNVASAKLAATKSGPVTTRPYSRYGRASFLAGYHSLPEWARFGGKEAVANAVRQKALFNGGTQMSMGRLLKAYPRVGQKVVRLTDPPILFEGPPEARLAAQAHRYADKAMKLAGRAPDTVVPPHEWEVKAAIRSCGLSTEKLEVRPYPLNVASGEGIRVNLHADNGFPVGGTMADPEAAAKVLAIAKTTYDRLSQAGRNVAAEMRRMEVESPHLFLFKGKVKEDYYKTDKVSDLGMRFYNVCPRPLGIIMQMSTQPLEAVARNVFSGDRIAPGFQGNHSAQGISLARGGAAKLAEVMEQQLKFDPNRNSVAYVHVGDDSWVIVRDRGGFVQFALDCSNFDLSQRSEVKEPVIDGLAQQLMTIDPVSAQVWQELMKRRLTLVTGTLVYEWKHAGPSGMPLQSKLNDVLMDILLKRLTTLLCDNSVFCSEEVVEEAVQTAGRSLGLSVRLEQYNRVEHRGRSNDLSRMLLEQPFLFIGYYFHGDGDKVRCYADVERTLAQRSYPTSKWMSSEKELKVKEAMRLGSLVVSLGQPPDEHRASFEAQRAHAERLLREVIAEFGDSQDPSLMWAVGQEVAGPELIPSLSGLLAVISQPERLETIWNPEKELPSTSTFVSLSWADEVEEEEAKELGGYRPPPSAGPLIGTPVQKVKPRIPQVPMASQGRMPPTVKREQKPRQPVQPASVAQGRESLRPPKKGKGKRALTLLDYDN